MQISPSHRVLKKAVVLAGATVSIALTQAAHAVVYSTTPTTVISATANGYNTLTLGLSSSSSTAAIIDQDPLVVVGYETLTNTLTFPANNAMRSIYYYTPSTKNTTLIAIPDGTVATSPFHETLGGGTPALIQVAPSGVVYGSQARTNVSGGTQYLGNDAFVYNPAGAGSYAVSNVSNLSAVGGGASYTYSNTSYGSTTATSTVYAFNPTTPTISPTSYTGFQIGSDNSVTGTITRYAGDNFNTSASPKSTTLGSDAFYLSGAGVTSTFAFSGAIGTSGETYDQLGQDTAFPALISHSVSITGMAGTAAVGYQQRYSASNSSNGQDAFVYTPTLGIKQIGLVGGIYNSSDGTIENSLTVRTNVNGQIAGTSIIQQTTTTNSGTDAWLYKPSATPGIASGFGTSTAGTYLQLGLTAPTSGTTVGNFSGTTGYHYSTIAFLQANGSVAGTSYREDSVGSYEGAAAYYSNGTSPSIDISPSNDTVHMFAANANSSAGNLYSTNTITAMNTLTSGKVLVGAIATRVSATAKGSVQLGQDAYVFDATSGKNYFVGLAEDPTLAGYNPAVTFDPSTSDYQFSTIGAISSTGEAVGFYETFSGASSTPTGAELFVWNETDGLEPLLAFNASQTAALAPYINSFEFGSDGTLYGPNIYINGGTTNVETAIYAYPIAVPEPTSLGLLTLAAGATLARRRRRLV